MHSRRVLVSFAGIALAAFVLMLAAPAAQAAVIPADISASGSITYDTVNSTSTAPGAHSGTMTSTVGGSDTNSAFADGSAGGTNPLTPTFTDTGDGFGIAASGATGALGYTLAGVDLSIALSNSSLTTWYKIVFLLAYDQNADADGADSYMSTEFTVERPAGSEVLYSQAYSDTLFGDERNGTNLASFGASITSSGSKFVTVLLAPGGSTTLIGDWTMEGEDFASSTATGTVTTLSVTIDSVTIAAVPEPTSFVLLGAGLLAVAGVRRWKRKRQR